MNPIASHLLDMPVRHVIGTEIKFQALNTGRIRRGRISRISSNGVLVIGRKGKRSFAPFYLITEIVDARRMAA